MAVIYAQYELRLYDTDSVATDDQNRNNSLFFISTLHHRPSPNDNSLHIDSNARFIKNHNHNSVGSNPSNWLIGFIHKNSSID